MTEDEMVGWHHRLDGHGFGWTLGVGDGQGGLACCGSWGHKESALRIRWPKYWSFSFNISPSNEQPGLIFFRMVCLDLLAVQGTLKIFSNTTAQKHQFFSAQLSSQSNSHSHT